MPEAYVNNDVVLDAINPVEGPDGYLTSPLLDETVRDYDHVAGEMWQNFLDSESGSVAEKDQAFSLAYYYFMKNAAALHNPTNTESLWVERFNAAGDELYGLISPTAAIDVAANELVELEQGRPNGLATNLYREIAKQSDGSQSELEPSDIEALREAVFAMFPDIVTVIESLPDGPYTSAQIRDAFQEIIDRMAQHNPEWENWNITNTPKKTMLSVMPKEKRIEVPDGRAPVSTKTQLLGLTLHELGIHAGRSVNGITTEDRLMSIGLPGYTDFEEGLGIFVEYLATGEIPDKTYDRYIDIALATGAINGLRLTREQLLELGIDREQIRAAARGQTTPDEASLLPGIRSHVNRIFRGGRGQPITNESGEIVNQAVYVKDMLYYQGFIKARAFAVDALRSGVTPNQLMTYLLAGKFDATDPTHVNYLAQEHSIKLL